jgi:aldehyde dehydrogenase (NAD+)
MNIATKGYSRTKPAFIGAEAKGLLIGGKWVQPLTGESAETFDPTTGEVLGRYALASAQDVDRAVASARRAFEGPWSKFTRADRQRVMLKLADLIEANYDELALLDSFDMGVPISFAPFIRPMVINTFRYMAGQAVAIHGKTLDNSLPDDILSFTLREPVGVVGGIIPWNGPIFNCTWKIAPALASGSTLVLKCAEQASYSPLRIGELCLEAGVPDGVINVITGLGSVAGQALAAHMDVDKVAFTGSTATGRKIVEASSGNFKRLTMELGGKSPNIVFADANLEEAIPGAAMAVFANSGQVCSAGTRLFVERKIYDEVTAGVAQFADTLKVGDSLDPSTQIGPLVSKQQLDRVTGYLSAGAAEGAEALAGGERASVDGLDNGYFVKPTIFKNVDNSMKTAREEIFGPVISAIPFDTVDEVAAMANDTQYGLGSGVWTRDLANAHQLARKIKAGSVWINCYQAMDPGVPFGGYKQSGYGLEGGPHHIEEYLKTKSVWIKTA